MMPQEDRLFTNIDVGRTGEQRYEKSEVLYKAVVVRPVEYGKGLFLAESEGSVVVGEKILSFIGPFKSQEDADPMSLQVWHQPPIFLETSPSTLYENFINNACTYIPKETDSSEDLSAATQPNCKIVISVQRDVNCLVGSQSLVGEVTLEAIREIKPGDELLFDYAGTEVHLREEEDFVCTCGSLSCRCKDGKTLQGSYGLTQDQALFLFKQNILSEHVIRSLEARWGINFFGRTSQ